MESLQGAILHPREGPVKALSRKVPGVPQGTPHGRKLTYPGDLKSPGAFNALLRSCMSGMGLLLQAAVSKDPGRHRLPRQIHPPDRDQQSSADQSRRRQGVVPWRDYADDNKSKVMTLDATSLSGGSCCTSFPTGLSTALRDSRKQMPQGEDRTGESRFLASIRISAKAAGRKERDVAGTAPSADRV